MTTERPSLSDAIATWDRAAWAAEAGAKEREVRDAILAAFPLEAWPTVELDRYALGTGVPQTFSWWVEFGSGVLGGVGGGNAMKHRIFRKADGSWYFPEGFANEQEAWEELRKELTDAFWLASAGDFDAIGMLPQLQNGSITLAKAISIYALASMLSIFAKSHRDHFMTPLGGDGDGGAWAWDGARRLLLTARQNHPELADWSAHEIASFLYAWAHPVQNPSIVKIAPGHNADLWPDCREHGYIRVGWGGHRRSPSLHARGVRRGVRAALRPHLQRQPAQDHREDQRGLDAHGARPRRQTSIACHRGARGSPRSSRSGARP